MFAIKKFNESSKEEEIINEIKIMKIASHPNIIRFFGVTNLQDNANYSLVLEYVEDGTLAKHLRDNARSLIEWKRQLKFAKEIAGAVSWLHHNKIIHGDLNPKNILMHQQTIKIADFGCSCLEGEKVSTKPRGSIPYVDPKYFNDTSYKLTEKSDIYSLALIFWELTSCSSPFDYETKKDDLIMLEILEGKREKPIPNTNGKFVALYEKCWQFEPDERPDICEVISKLNSIVPIMSEKNEVSTDFDFKESEKGEQTENEVSTDFNSKENKNFDLSNCDEDCDLNHVNYRSLSYIVLF